MTQLLSASGKNTSSESVGKHIEETRKIGDDLLIQLIRQLNITPQSNNFTKVFSYYISNDTFIKGRNGYIRP